MSAFDFVGEMFVNLDAYMQTDPALLGLRRIAFDRPYGAPDNTGYRLGATLDAPATDPIVWMARYKLTGAINIDFRTGGLVDAFNNTIQLSALRLFAIFNHSDNPLTGGAPGAGFCIVGGSFMTALTVGGTGVVLGASDAFILKELVAIGDSAERLTLFPAGDPDLDVILLGEGAYL